MLKSPVRKKSKNSTEKSFKSKSSISLPGFKDVANDEFANDIYDLHASFEGKANLLDDAEDEFANRLAQSSVSISNKPEKKAAAEQSEQTVGDEQPEQREAAEEKSVGICYVADEPCLTSEIDDFGSPQKVPRRPAANLMNYYSSFSFAHTVVDADFNRSQVIFCGSNHRGLGFYELVKDLINKGKNIRAVFMEEINSDAQAKDPKQNIIDRHFVATTSERESLKYALPLAEIDTKTVVDHLVKESSSYLDYYLSAKDESGRAIVNLEGKSQNDYLHSYYSEFLNLLDAKNIAIGGIDHSFYRIMSGYDGYDSNRQGQMNYHAAMIIKSYIERLNRQQVPLQENEVILVSLGNAHTINGFAGYKDSDERSVAIQSVPTIFKFESSNIPTATISFVADADIVKKDGYDTARTIIQRNLYSSYDISTSSAQKPPSNSRYTSKYLAIANTDHELDRRVSEFADLIVAPVRSQASFALMEAPSPPSSSASSSSSSFGRR